MDPLSIAGSIAGLVSLTLSVGAGLDSIISTYRGSNSDAVKLSLELACLCQCIKIIEKSMPGLANRKFPDTPEFHSFRLCIETLSEIHLLVPGAKDRKTRVAQNGQPATDNKNDSTSGVSSWEKWKWIRNKPKVQDLMERVTNHKTTMILYLAGEQLKLLEDRLQTFGLAMLEENQKVLKSLDVWKHDTVLKDMSHYFSPANTHPQIRLETAVKLRHLDTGLWFIDTPSYKKWSTGTSPKRNSWVWGMAGAGKTVLASLAITAELQRASGNQDRGVAYFFCDYKTSDTLNIKVIIGSLLFQYLQGEMRLRRK